MPSSAACRTADPKPARSGARLRVAENECTWVCVRPDVVTKLISCVPATGSRTSDCNRRQHRISPVSWFCRLPLPYSNDLGSLPMQARLAFLPMIGNLHPSATFNLCQRSFITTPSGYFNFMKQFAKKIQPHFLHKYAIFTDSVFTINLNSTAYRA